MEVRDNSYETVVAPYLEACGATLEVLALTAPDARRLLHEETMFSSLHTLGLENPRWYDSETAANFESDFLRRCPNLVRFSGAAGMEYSAYLRALTLHCPLLQVLSLECSTIDTADLIALLRACTQLHTIMLRPLDRYTKPADIAAIAEHGHNLRSLLLDEPTAEMIDAIAPRLPQIEHLALISGCSWVVLPIDQLVGHCGNLRSLKLTCLQELSEPALVALLSGTPLLEELDLKSYREPCLTDIVLRALGKSCPRLRLLSFSTADPKDITADSFKALAQGCRGLQGFAGGYTTWKLAREAGIPIRRIVSKRWDGVFEAAYNWVA
jgi:hypothetical protein